MPDPKTAVVVIPLMNVARLRAKLEAQQKSAYRIHTGPTARDAVQKILDAFLEALPGGTPTEAPAPVRAPQPRRVSGPVRPGQRAIAQQSRSAVREVEGEVTEEIAAAMLSGPPDAGA